ncbi:hypothetical protein FOQG_16872, partial [Fusarium oxysporum f. sp. raphani 54005]
MEVSHTASSDKPKKFVFQSGSGCIQSPPDSVQDSQLIIPGWKLG